MADQYLSKISVRGLVEFVYRSGDLDLRFQGKSRAAEGTRIHQRIQNSQGMDYDKEVFLQKSFEFDDPHDQVPVKLVVSGRADGILKTEEGFTIDEIKSTSTFLEDIDEHTYPLHWAQAKIYGAIFCEEEGLDAITIQLTYADFESLSVKRIKVPYKRDVLVSFFETTVAQYKKWVIYRKNWQKIRNNSLNDLTFPFANYRKGQREMAVSVYNAFKNGQNAFIEAPTGIGKTISSLFPTLKAMHEGLVDKIFYLSAKTITKKVAEDTLKVLYNHSDNALKLKALTLTAKDKICFLDQATCYPDKCTHAKGHFDRCNDALWDLLHNDVVLSRDTVEIYAQKHHICPYEFSLDVALFADVIICDYNYAFDPRVYLRRFFDAPTESFAFLVDEAHNLVDRARTMYSAELHKDKVMAIKNEIKAYDKSLMKQMEGINKMMLEIRKRCDEDGIYVDKEEVADIYTQLKRRASVIEKWLVKSQSSEIYDLVLDFYFEILTYLRISELYDDGFLFYITEGNSSKTTFKLFCINPASQLMRFINNSKASIFFSATLSPLDYYQKILSGDDNAKKLKLPSPFDPNRKLVLFSEDVSVKYKDREAALLPICDYLYNMGMSKEGNYMVFLPSYTYLKHVTDLFITQYASEFDIIIQEREMDDQDKEAFLYQFEHHHNLRNTDECTAAVRRGKSLICFAVLGGVFSEGIDLTGNLLIGVALIGVGLPMMNFENNLIKAYFDDYNQQGFEYAYQYPGINKVMQGAGRVIRSETDRGVIILLDKRLSNRYYKRLLPRDWGHTTARRETSKEIIQNFWEE
ncbi:ATP-dependent DNA helicase [Fusibacter ferrireducens]|uniref:ATP-dependent DNA helicase n=1 Tax=Fusibacter ferrireducens TaxID=2785058 RepID=A0ABR9ZS49_9FIRM|nr:ATP-dependent DNA helicase [Fusibacter ferrireducens]MBF4693283.1 ATP-dependent DNA helicase [Fusibacter ferrireducens]